MSTIPTPPLPADEEDDKVFRVDEEQVFMEEKKRPPKPKGGE